MRFVVGALLFLFCLFPQPALPFAADEISVLESSVKESPVGNRIAFWAEQFIGTPYDMDPLGDYVTRAAIVADERVDCMYLTFRAVELALSNSPEKAIDRALTMRFHTRGVLKDGKVVNYDDRYQDGIDMIRSGKYGAEITARLGKTRQISEPNSGDPIDFLPAVEVRKGMNELITGDIIFFVGDPSRRAVGGIIAHMGILKVELKDGGLIRTVYLIHASGTKKRGGSVKKVLLDEYLAHMQHAGAKISRLNDSRP
ncbi:MAG TPA: hypothetical protein VLX12_07355 [Syntrophorhabdales bacterium]|nr:hypothetical protein [Syntrophorhabdales bacterium]